MKTKIALAAAALAFVAAAPAAQASFKVIKWDTGFCQVWNNTTPWDAGPFGWRTVSRNFQSLDGAITQRHNLIKAGQCW
jgi:ABC-type amino acid transport substrate-binding protein